MNESMHLYIGAAFIVGILAGVLFARFCMPEYKKHKALQKELEKAQFALAQNQQELDDHFDKSSQLLQEVAQVQQKLSDHLKQSANRLQAQKSIVATQADAKLEEAESEEAQVQLEERKHEETSTEPAKDYADGAAGLLTGKETPEDNKTEPQATEKEATKA